MENKSVEECIVLIKHGKKAEARQLLQSILQSNLQNLNAWYWYVETFDTPEQKLKALHLCLKYNPNDQKVRDAIHTFKTKHLQVAKAGTVSNYPTPKKVRRSVSKKRNKNLLIFGTILALGTLGIICIFIIGIFLRNQLPGTISTPQSGIVPTKVNTPLPASGKWQISTSKSEFDNSTTVVLALEAENSVKGWLDTTLPILILRCKEKEMDVFINVGTQSNVEYGKTDSATVRVRFDQNEAFEVVADESTDGEALFFPNPYDMIISMLQSKEMVFGFTPFNADPVVTTFDLRGLANVVEPLKQSCNWNGEPR